MKALKHISLAGPVLNGNEKKYVMDCIDTGWISSNGKYVTAFEEKFAEFCGVQEALSCANGTVALHLPLLAYGIGPGDEVIVPTFTYIATANAVKYCGATPVLVDCEESTWNMDPSLIEEKITEKTKGIIVVHLYGHPVDMDPIMEIARKHNLFVIEDAAEAHGAEYKGKIVGSIGDVGTFSFFGNKIISTGEGGMITTNNKELAAKMRLLRGQGMDPKKRYWFDVVGYNYRMTNMQAAIGLGQLENIDWHLSKRKDVANAYIAQFSAYSELFTLQPEMPWAKHSYWMVSILLSDKIKISRDELMNLLAVDGIETRPLFYPMHQMPPYFEESTYPSADKISARGLNIPTNAVLSDAEINYICDRLVYHCNNNI
ncbi:DegT/DnrJ/EryC1/StrS family aminotransferase [Paenibacillus radicis (ex Gao et al. 2016)]|uniref:GDP-perosamine synthase n=1 Tax=Paenibacillus radicis (ex Gao et al. 2016) TaxID=1737354 RepID=A0A917H0C4_9BACL|nr:DegT/DnrJ/EryC1/StrS family aminotransferase [Paenibacillus radicis (ex Gao et al. 2016)]GGG63318.1 GDP-perosamine synthase [Paenibacillus radicis (ex Gao et al. 2016)]